jgi:hypothetical protein
MIVAEFSTISFVRTPQAPHCSELPVTAAPGVRAHCALVGHEQHHFALLLLGIVAIAMAIGSALAASRPAAAALFVIGLAVLGIALIGDRPTIHNTRHIDVIYQGAKGVAGAGYSLEILAGALAVLAALARLAFTSEET